MNRSAQHLERGTEVERAVAPARGPDDVAEVGADDRRAATVLDKTCRHEADDADAPWAAHDRRGCAASIGRPPLGPRRRRSSSGRAGSGSRPRAPRHASRRSRRIVGQQQVRRLEGLPHPAGRVEPRRDGERDGLEIDGVGRDPGPLEEGRDPGSRVAVRSRSSPSRAIARFSPTIGATSATVPMVARSARSSAAAGPPGSSARRSCATLNATPLPASRRSGYVASGRCGLTIGERVGQDRGDAMVVGHDDVDPARVRRGDLGDAGACRSRP